MTDKERIQVVMNHYHLNNVAFCNKVGLNQATLSNILSDRTNPSLPVLRSITDAFPELNPTWIFLGLGEMLKSNEHTTSEATSDSTEKTGDLFSSNKDSDNNDLFSALSAMSSPSSSTSHSSPVAHQRTTAPVPKAQPINVSEIVTGVVTQLQKPMRKIKEVRIFFDDGTYETFS